MTDPVKQKIQSLCPDVMLLPEYPYNPDAAKAIVELEKIAGKTLWNSTLQETATMHIENYRQQQAGDYRAMLEGRYEGRPVSLAVVLRAIQKGAKYPALMEYWFGKIQGEFIIKNDDAESVVWKLWQDNYDDQDEATKAFIGSLILNV